MNDFLGPLLILAAVSGASVFLVWLFHAYTLNAGRKELQNYRERVVVLSDKIDALKDRHKILLHMDNGVVVPMRGETLAAYNHVAERLEHHRQIWLKLMDVWEQSQGLLESERLFGSGRARAARRSLREANAPAALKDLIGDCEVPLDRIEHAHDQAAADRIACQQEDQQLVLQLNTVTAASISIAPYEPDRSTVAALVEQAQGLLPADPLGTIRCLTEARSKISELRSRAARILEHAAAATALAKKIADIQQAAAQRRSQGFLLEEQGANPDPVLADVLQQHAAALDALNLANDAGAGTLLSKASLLVDQARLGMEQHVAARTRCESEIPARHAEARQLAEAQTLARGHHAELMRDFAAETWLGVADNCQRAQASLATAEQYTAEAVRHAAANVQHFVLASKRLDQAAENYKYARAELTAVGKRLRELIELRSAFQAQIGQLHGRSDRVKGLLQASNADRALANERFRGARLTLDRLVEESRLQRPDWTRLTARIREIDTDLDRVEQLAKEDIQLAQQAAAEITETEKVIRDVRAFRDQGVVPDVSAAESQLAQARGCLAAQGYEETIRLANAAEQMARTILQDAIGQAQRRQQELESQRRAELAAATPAPQIHAEPELQ